MKKTKLILILALCLALFCGCMVDHGENKFAMVYDSINIGKEGTHISQIQAKLGEGRWIKSLDTYHTFFWQNGDMVIMVIFDTYARAVCKQKNW